MKFNHSVNDQLHMIGKDTCGMFQIYFYVNLFNPLDNTSILNQRNVNK